MVEQPDQRARDAYLRMRQAKEIELRTFRGALADWPDNPLSHIRQGIADLVDVLGNDLAVLDKLITAWDADKRQFSLR